MNLILNASHVECAGYDEADRARRLLPASRNINSPTIFVRIIKPDILAANIKRLSTSMMGTIDSAM